MFLRGMPHLCYRMRRLTTKDGGVRGRHASQEDEPSPDFYRLTEDHPLPESKPVLQPALRARMNGTYGVPVSGQLLLSGTHSEVSALMPSRCQSLNAASAISPSLLSRNIEATQIHLRANNGLGLMVGAVRPDLVLGLSQTLHPSLDPNAYMSLPRPYYANIGEGGNPLLSDGSVRLQQLINIERKNAAAAEMARIAAMNNFLSLRKANDKNCLL
mmetsp:Transcript_25499/g.75130  ORF Transcript_25499/g.75130 Transcript_25499/m.75130 type:complete len:215 (-) Transcript_25499:235-879(-)